MIRRRTHDDWLASVFWMITLFDGGKERIHIDMSRNPERDNTGLGLVDRQLLKLWLTNACAQMDQVDI